MNRGKHQLLIGDNRKTLRTIAPGSVQCAVTSPPYFALRSYLPKGHPDKALELGSEKTIDAYLANQLEVFRLVRTALHETGTLFCNMGDGYADDSKWGGRTGGKHVTGLHGESIGRAKNKTGLQAGDQMLVPFRFAIAMQADGWILRDTIIWSKSSPMPISVSGWRWVRCRVKKSSGIYQTDQKQSVTRMGAGFNERYDGVEGFSAQWQPCPGCSKCNANGGYVLRRGKWRTTTSFEYVFMFAKGDKYFCDGDAVQEEATTRPHSGGHVGGTDYAVGPMFRNGHSQREQPDRIWGTETRNPRSVWTIPSESLKEKHYAAYPSELVRRIIMAATSAAGCCPKCRTPYAPVVESDRVATRPGSTTKVQRPAELNGQRLDGRGFDRSEVGNRDPQRHVAVSRITGYRASCACNAGEPIPCIVLDPFAGSGTTLQTAVWYGRDAMGCELSEDYAKIAERRIAKPPRCLIRERKRERKPEINVELDADGLFAGM